MKTTQVRKSILMGAALAGLAVSSMPQIVYGTSPGRRITPESLYDDVLRFRIQVNVQEDTAKVVVIVEDRHEKEVPVIAAWLQVQDPKSGEMLLACQLAAAKAVSYDFGTTTEFSMTRQWLPNAKIGIGYQVKDAPSGGGYWFLPVDFVGAAEQVEKQLRAEPPASERGAMRAFLDQIRPIVVNSTHGENCDRLIAQVVDEKRWTVSRMPISEAHLRVDSTLTLEERKTQILRGTLDDLKVGGDCWAVEYDGRGNDLTGYVDAGTGKLIFVWVIPEG